MGGAPRYIPWLAGALVVLAMPLQAARPARPWQALEARRAAIGKVEIEIIDVFDLARPDENTWVGRTANHLHMSTREAVIRRVLLFAGRCPNCRVSEVLSPVTSPVPHAPGLGGQRA